MKRLAEEVLRRFPEIRDHFAFVEPDSGFGAMFVLVRWFDDQPEFTPELVSRLVDLEDWCCEQPKGADASDDAVTILILGLHEELFEFDRARELIPELLPMSDLLENRDYYVQWVGQENFDKALALYPESRTDPTTPAG